MAGKLTVSWVAVALAVLVSFLVDPAVSTSWGVPEEGVREAPVKVSRSLYFFISEAGVPVMVGVAAVVNSYSQLLVESVQVATSCSLWVRDTTCLVV